MSVAEDEGIQSELVALGSEWSQKFPEFVLQGRPDLLKAFSFLKSFEQAARDHLPEVATLHELDAEVRRAQEALPLETIAEALNALQRLSALKTPANGIGLADPDTQLVRIGQRVARFVDALSLYCAPEQLPAVFARMLDCVDAIATLLPLIEQEITTHNRKQRRAASAQGGKTKAEKYEPLKKIVLAKAAQLRAKRRMLSALQLGNKISDAVLTDPRLRGKVREAGLSEESLAKTFSGWIRAKDKSG